jgi:superfamily I DNA/RNA helicase
MEVLVYRQSDFNKILRRLRNAGGEASTAYQKIAAIRQSIELDAESPGRLATHGESRIRYAVKYRLTDNYRLVTLQTGGVCIFLFAGKHDEAEAWLDRHRGLEIAIDRRNNRIEPIETVANPELAPNLTPTETTAPLLNQVAGVDWQDKVPIAILREYLLGITVDTADDRVRMIMDDIRRSDQKLADYLIEVIGLLRQGRTEDANRRTRLYLGEVEIVEADEKIATETLDSVVNADTLIRLGRLTPDQIEVWEDPKRFQEWILFLHPDQKRVVDEDFDQPVILSGVSGSGKTCALVHRAKRLAELYRDRVLVLTLNETLADMLKTLIDRLPDSQNLRIEVMPYYEYVAALLEHVGLDRLLTLLEDYVELGKAIQFFRDRTFPAALNRLIKFREEFELRREWDRFIGGFKPGEERWERMTRLEVFLHGQQQNLDARKYIREEFDLVRSAFRNVEHYRGYLEGYPREGRSIALQTGRRREPILELLREWEEWQIANGLQDHLALTQCALLVLNDLNQTLPRQLRYRAVLVDEFQDFCTLDLELLCKIPTSNVNGLFLAGDLAQKVFTKDSNLDKGIGTQRVSRRITKNYRNTRQILETATLLVDNQINPAKASGSGVEILKPEYAEREGPRPLACKANDPIGAAWAYAADRLDAGYMGFAICIATADPVGYSVKEILGAKPDGIEASRLTGSYILDPNTVVVSELPDVKGFEFCLMIILGLDSGAFPSADSAIGEHWRDALRLYVAITRGRDEVRLIYREQPSPFLGSMWDGLEHLVIEVTTGAELPMTPREEELKEAAAIAVESSQSLNGYPIVEMPPEPTERELAVALGITPTELAIYSQQHFQFFTTGSTQFPNHIVDAILNHYKVAAKFTRSVMEQHASSNIRPRVISEERPDRCHQCGKTAIPDGSGLCYTCALGD